MKSSKILVPFEPTVSQIRGGVGVQCDAAGRADGDIAGLNLANT